jgi:RNA polymerase sigma-32 factor
MTLKQLPIQFETSGSFESYMAYVNSIPLLDEQQERALFLRYQEQNDLSAVQDIVLSHLRFVAYVARKYQGYGMRLDDLVQEGTIGLMKSVKKFNLDFGVRLASFAIHYIKAEIHEFIIRNWRLVKAATTKAKRKLFFNLRRLKSTSEWLGHKEKQEIAQELGVEIQDIGDMEVQLSQPDLFVYSESTPEGDEAATARDCLLVDKTEPFYDTIIEQDFKQKNIANINTIVESLDERSRDIIKNRWLRDEKKTHKFLSEKYQVSQERIRQIEEKALKKIKSKLSVQKQ